MLVIGKELGMSVGDFDLFIERLNENNTLILRPGRRFELKFRKLWLILDGIIDFNKLVFNEY